MAQNTSQWSATGSFSDGSTLPETSNATWTVSDTSIVTVTSATGVVTIASAGKIWGANVGITATLAPATPGTGTIMCIASDSGSVAPRMPQQNDHWQALGLSPWGTWWGFQEPAATSRLNGSGSSLFNLTASNPSDANAAYRVTVPGWTRVGVSLSGTGGVSNDFRVASGSGPNLSTTSVAMLIYAKGQPLGAIGQTGFGNSILQIANSGDPNLRMLSAIDPAGAGNCDYYAVATSDASNIYRLEGPNLSHNDNRIHPFLIVTDRANSRFLAATDLVVALSSSVPAITTDATKYFGGGFANLSSSIVWATMVTGSVAEALSTTSASADLLSRLGWTVMWKDTPAESGSLKMPFLPSHWETLGYVPWTAAWNFQTTALTSLNFRVKSFSDWPGRNVDGFNLNVQSATPHQPIPGWNRLGAFCSGTNPKRMDLQTVYGSPPLWDPTGSFAMLAYVYTDLTGANGTLLGRTNYADTTPGNNAYVACGGAGNGIIVYCSGSSTTGSNSIRDSRAHPILFVYDKTNSRVKGYTEKGAVTGTFHALTITNVLGSTASLFFGTAGTTPASVCSATFLYGAMCTGTVAESFSDNGKASKLLKDLGWTVTW